MRAARETPTVGDDSMIDKRLLDILCDPVTKSPVRPLAAGELEALGRAVAAGKISTEGGAALKAPPSAGLITRDGRTIYRIEDDIPVMLPDEAIATSQIDDFPRT
jgi:uncharacterized protein YbaR (Trm112 family)